jgi:hypothetical protein
MKSMKKALKVELVIFYAVALVILTSCEGGNGESLTEPLNQIDQTPDVTQESVIQESFGNSSFGYAKFK